MVIPHFWTISKELGVVCPVVDMTIDDGERPHEGAVVPASAGIGNGRFAVLAKGEDEAEPTLLSAVVLFLQASHPPNRILSDPLKSRWSLVHVRQRRTLNSFFIPKVRHLPTWR